MTSKPFNRLHGAKRNERQAVVSYFQDSAKPKFLRIGIYDLMVKQKPHEFIEWISRPIPNTKAGRRKLRLFWWRINNNCENKSCLLVPVVYPWREQSA